MAPPSAGPFLYPKELLMERLVVLCVAVTALTALSGIVVVLMLGLSMLLGALV